jgi:hypothetical protein
MNRSTAEHGASDMSDAKRDGADELLVGTLNDTAPVPDRLAEVMRANGAELEKLRPPTRTTSG